MKTLKILSLLLSYPEARWFREAQPMIDVLEREAVLAPSLRVELANFIRALTSMDLMDAQSDYVETFDRGRALSLLLFEHVHGESRDRGQAMVDLMKVYAEHGLELAARELPDHLPLFLEFLSQRPAPEAVAWLGEVQHILALLQARLEQRGNCYRVIFDALLSVAEGSVDLDSVRGQAATEPPDDTPEALDRVWEEEAVRFGADPVQTSPSSSAGAAGEQRISPESIQRHRRTS